MERHKLKAVTDNLGKYCYLAGSSDHIEVIEWRNSEGFDVTIATNSRDESFKLTHGELKAIQALTIALDTE